MTTIFTGWEPRHTEMFGRYTLKLSHRLHESELFTDEALAALIEGYPDDLYNLNSMGSPEDPRFLWRRGLLGDCAGADVIAGIRAGRLWLNLRRVHEVSELYARLLDRIFAEMEANVPGLETFKRNFGILISSPRAQVYYHADVPGQALWQIRGAKRVWIYPNAEPFLREQDMEGAIMGVTEEEIPYEPWFDEHAEVHDLMPGQMLHWPLNGPHRVVNHDCMNVSVTTEHWTSAIRRSYAVRYANGVLRRAGWRSPSPSVSGPAVYAKAALAMAHRKFLRKPPMSATAAYDFKLDAASRGQVIDLPPAIAAE
jgi:hypothetical protein